MPALAQVPQTAVQKSACSAESVVGLAGQGLAIPNQAPTTSGVGGLFFASTFFVVLKVKSKIATANTAKQVKRALRDFMESSLGPRLTFLDFG
jgi:hypothetical protein